MATRIKRSPEPRPGWRANIRSMVTLTPRKFLIRQPTPLKVPLPSVTMCWIWLNQSTIPTADRISYAADDDFTIEQKLLLFGTVGNAHLLTSWFTGRRHRIRHEFLYCQVHINADGDFAIALGLSAPTAGYLAIVRESGDVTVYIDGVEVGSEANWARAFTVEKIGAGTRVT